MFPPLNVEVEQLLISGSFRTTYKRKFLRNETNLDKLKYCYHLIETTNGPLLIQKFGEHWPING